MTIRDLLVHIDQTQAAQVRLEAGLKLTSIGRRSHRAVSCGRAVHAQGGRLSPAGRRGAEHLRHAEAEAEPVFKAALQAAERRGVELETRLETGSLDRLPSILARIARNADLIVVGEPRPKERDG